MLKDLIKNAKEEKRMRGDEFPALSVALFDNGDFWNLSKEEMRALLQEAIYLLRDKDQNAESELIENVEEWHNELIEDVEDVEDVILPVPNPASFEKIPLPIPFCRL